jgi:hypothetical protein
MYVPTVLCDHLGVGSDSLWQGTYFINMAGVLLTLHVYESISPVFLDYERAEAEVFILTDMVVLTDGGRAVITSYITRMMQSMPPGSRRSPHYRFHDYAVGDMSRYTFRLENDITKGIAGMTIAGYTDLFTTSLLMTNQESKFFLSEAREIGNHRVSVASVTHSTYLEALCAEMMYARDVTEREA